jgi:uncharacterized protein YggE
MNKLSGFLAAAMAGAFLWSNLEPVPAAVAPTGAISVSGEAEVRVVPDQVVITLGIETSHRELSVAVRRNDDRTKEVIRVAADHGIQPKDIQTDFISIENSYEDYYADPPIITGYIVRKTVVLTLRDIDKFERLLTDLSETGVTSVHGVQFRTTELRKYRDQARELATRAALEKARDMAGVLDLKVGPATNISEDNVGWWSWYGYGWWGYRSQAMTQNVVVNVEELPPTSSDSSFAPGQISVTARVTISFQTSG